LVPDVTRDRVALGLHVEPGDLRTAPFEPCCCLSADAACCAGDEHALVHHRLQKVGVGGAGLVDEHAGEHFCIGALNRFLTVAQHQLPDGPLPS
jgi:hypothetical protein